MEAWYALYTKPGQEELVASQLEQQGLEPFLPQFTERRRGKAPRVQPLFPCYLFVRADLECVARSSLQWTPGLRCLVAFGGVPARVPDEAISLLHKRLVQMEEQGGWLQPRFRPGQRVRLREGPLAGLEAVFEGSLGPNDRVRILVRFLGEVNRAVVPADMIEGVAESSPPRRTRGRGRRIRSNVDS